MLTTVYANLSKISPMTVLLVYLAFIPAFAVVFCGLPGRTFYAPYAHLEPSALADATAVKRNIAASMVQSFAEHDESANGWRIATIDTETIDLGADPQKELSFTAYYFAVKYKDGEETAAEGGPLTTRVSLLKSATPSRPGWIVCHQVSLPSDGATVRPASFDKHLLFRPPDGVPLQVDSLCWGANEEIAMQKLLNGWSGDPRALSGFWWRMLYFSATTITTVGFGDIVPITTTARALTALEAIAGWLLAGLFLNSLALRIAKSHP